jgi:hypothetical protein
VRSSKTGGDSDQLRGRFFRIVLLRVGDDIAARSESGNAGILLQMSGHFAATELGSGDVDEADRCHSMRAQLPSLRKSFLPGHCKLPELPRTRAWRQREARAFLAGSNKEPRACGA